ncbi:MAG: hypothetical protein MI923_07990 [Phycisphaerales bacterium]|nr:hypothetical protein [Phycisphaerales bacterium]
MALTANRDLNRYVDQELRSFPVAASEHVWKGAFVGVDRTTGYVRNLQSEDLFAGIAYEEIDNTNGSDGEVSVRLYTQGDFVLTTLAASQALLGSAVYAIDNEITTLLPSEGATYMGVFMALLGSGAGIVRILPMGSQQVEETVTVAISGSTSAAVTHPVMIPQRNIRVISLEVSLITIPDQGNLDVGTTLADPDELVNAFNLATLSSNTPAAPILASNRKVDAGIPILAKVGQATSTAADGGMLTMRYIELP